MDGHPDDLELELLRSGDGEQAAADHAAACPSCQARLGRLRALAGGAPVVPLEVPAAVEELILSAARAAADRARRRRAVGWAGSAVLAAAAAGALFVLAHRAPAARADVDGDGVVDILDAFALARALDRGQPVRPEWDLNGDGVVDAADVERAAQLAVALRGGG